MDSATETSPRARFRNSRTPAGFTPKGWPSGLRTRGRFSTFEPAKSKERWMDGWMDGWGWNGVEALAVALSSTVDSAAETPPGLPGHGCGTAEPQQDSGPRGGPLVCGPGAVSAPSNQLYKSKEMDGWMDGWEWNRVECGSFGRGSEQHCGFGYRNTS